MKPFIILNTDVSTKGSFIEYKKSKFYIHRIDIKSINDAINIVMPVYNWIRIRYKTNRNTFIYEWVNTTREEINMLINNSKYNNKINDLLNE